MHWFCKEKIPLCHLPVGNEYTLGSNTSPFFHMQSIVHIDPNCHRKTSELGLNYKKRTFICSNPSYSRHSVVYC